MAFQALQTIDATAIPNLPDGTWHLEYRERLANGALVTRRRKAEGDEIQVVRTVLETELANGHLPPGRVTIVNAESLHIQFGGLTPAATLSIHLPKPTHP